MKGAFQRPRLTLSAPTALAVLSALSLQSAWAHPSAFSDLSMAAAKAKAKAENKILIIDFTASWCGPCHKMDKESWSQPSVERWVKDNAVAVQVDVDLDKPTAQSFKINAMPTVVVFHSGKEVEFDRDTGYKNASELLAWLNGIKQGKTSVSVLTDQISSVIGKGGEAEVHGRYQLGSKLLFKQKYAEAMEQYLWLWKNMPKLTPQLGGIRASLMASDIERLVKQYPPAKEQFSAIRDAALKSKDRADWIILNQALGETSVTLKWFDQAKKSPTEKAEVYKYGYMLQDLLISNERLADVGLYLYKDPVLHVREIHKVAEETKKLSKNYDPFPQEAAILYTCYLAAHLDDKADSIARETLTLENTPAMRNRLVITAFQAGQFRNSQLKWLDELLPKNDPNFLIERGAIYSQIDQPERALKDFEKAIANGQKSSAIYTARGNAHLQLHHDDLAMADFNIANTMDPRSAWPWVSKSALLYRQKKYQEAYTAGNKAVEVDPRQFGGFCNRGKAALKLGKYDEAVADLTKSTESNSRLYKGESYFYRAVAYEKLGKSQLAKKDMSMATALKFKAPPGEV